ncbi:mediator of RNA polymerase II transcription subunit 28 [Sigmodon hispidus]
MFSRQPPSPLPPPPTWGAWGSETTVSQHFGGQVAVVCPETRSSYQRGCLRSELQRKDALVQKHLTKLRHWQQVLEDINVEYKKPVEMPQGSLAYLEQASANIPAPLKQT